MCVCVSPVTWVLCIAVAVPGGAHSIVLRLALAGASLAPEQAAGLVDDARQGLQGLEGSVHSVGHVGTDTHTTTWRDTHMTLDVSNRPGRCQ